MNSNNKTLQGLKKVNDRLLGIETFLLALITILLVAAIFIEVVCRYFLFISAAWAEELTRYLFIWLTYIGSAYAICDNSHTEIDVLKQVLMKIKGPAREKCKSACEYLEKLLASAMANAENNHNMDVSRLYVAECFVCPGPTLKRIRPKDHGRAHRILKRTSHVTIVLKEREI